MVTIEYETSDACGQTASCTSSFSVEAAPELTVTCPASVSYESCTTQAEIDAAFASWIAEFGFNGGCETTATDLSDYLAPDRCEGGVITIEYVATDACGQEVSCTASFSVEGNPELEVYCPAPVAMESCYSQAEIDLAFANWLAGFGYTGGCETSGSDLSDYVAPDRCEGGVVTIEFMVGEFCGQETSCVSTFTVEAAPELTVTCPAPLSFDSCTPQAEIDLAFANWLAGFGYSGGCEAVATDLSAYTIPDRCEDIEIVIEYVVTDACGQEAVCVSTFSIEGVSEISVTCPAPVSFGTCSDQSEIDAAFADWIAGFSYTGGCETSVTDLSTFVAPNRCDGGVVVIEYMVTDACGQEVVCISTFSVDATPELTVSCPANMVIQSCNTQEYIDAEFASWISSFSFSGGCEATASNLSGYTAPLRCSGGIVTVEYEATDNCGQIVSCVSTFTVHGVPTLLIVCPDDITLDACNTQAEIETAFANWLASFGHVGGCDVEESDLSGYTAPLFCTGGTVTVFFEVSGACDMYGSCSASFTVEETPVIELACPPDLHIQCGISDAPAYTSWAQFVAAGGSALNTCGVVESTFTLVSEVSDGNYCPEIVTRVYSVEDVCGNIAYCEQVITVNDTQAPILTRVNPLLEDIPNGGTLELQCYSWDAEWEVPHFVLEDVVATDNCGIVSFDFFVEIEDAADCKEDGYYRQIHYLWIAVDGCGNVSEYGFKMQIVDNIPPEFLGVPEDITLSCGEVIREIDVRICDSEPGEGVIHVIDECECATVEIELDTLPGICESNYTIIRRWIATDLCGNTSVAEQRITYVDDEAPTFLVLHPELSNVENGGIVKFSCDEGGMPQWLYDLNSEIVMVVDNCSDMTEAEIEFSSEEIDRNPQCSPERPYFIRQKLQWIATDDSGNVGEFVIYVDIIDDTPPVIEGAREYVCGAIPDVWEGITVYDDCSGSVRKSSREYQSLDPCTGERIWVRELSATDACGNRTVFKQYLLPDIFEGPKIQLKKNTFNFGDTLQITCGSGLPNLSINDVLIESASCDALTKKSFEYVEIDDNVCLESGFARMYRGIWTAEDRCGNITQAEIFVGMYDNTPPRFKQFPVSIELTCEDELPELIAIDDCDEDVTYTEDWTIIRYDCYNDAEYMRKVTATDACGNAAVVYQRVIYVPDNSIKFHNVPEDMCGAYSTDDVFAIDICKNDTLEVTFVDRLIKECGETQKIMRTWYAENECGMVDSVSRIQVLNPTAPTFVAVNPMLENVASGTVFEMTCTDFYDRGEFKPGDMLAFDDCGDTLEVHFSDFREEFECRRDHPITRIVYTWETMDICETKVVYEITVELTDTEAPTLVGVPADITLICQDLPPVPDVYAYDDRGEATLSFESWQDGSGDEYDIYRRWTATDRCGNSTSEVQKIHMVNETDFECEIYGPANANCNSKEVYLYGIIRNGHGPFKYEWEVISGLCRILDGQGSTRVHIFTGFSESVIKLTVTDRHGCVTECYFTIECEFVALKNGDDIDIDVRGVESLDMAVAPNPANDLIQLSVNQDMSNVRVDFVNMLGQVSSTFEVEQLHHGGWHSLNVSGLQPGTYMMLVYSEANVVYRERIEIVK